MSNIHLSECEQMFQAAEFNNVKTIEYLVNEKKTPITVTDYNGRTPAHIAAMYGQVNAVKFFVEKDSSLLEATDRAEETILMKAIPYGHLNVIKYLVENCNVSITQRYSQRHYGNTAIHLATSNGQLGVLKYFIEERNGDVNIENSFRESPLFFAAENKLYRIIQYLIEERKANAIKIDSKGHNILFKAVDIDDLGFMKYLIDMKHIPFDLNWRGFFGDTLVHRAVERNRLNVLLYLVNEKHADVNIADELGNTPLHAAASRNNYRVCRFLMEHGADTNIENEKGELPVDKTEDERLITYMTNYASDVRRRRSVPETFVSQSAAYSTLAPIRWIAGDSNSVGGLISGPSPNVGSLFQFQNFLAVGEVIFRNSKTATAVNQRFKNHYFSSPREVILNNMDPLAIDAVQRVPNFRNHRS